MLRSHFTYTTHSRHRVFLSSSNFFSWSRNTTRNLEDGTLLSKTPMASHLNVLFPWGFLTWNFMIYVISPIWTLHYISLMHPELINLTKPGSCGTPCYVSLRNLLLSLPYISSNTLLRTLSSNILLSYIMIIVWTFWPIPSSQRTFGHPMDPISPSVQPINYFLMHSGFIPSTWCIKLNLLFWII
jgi:hypothetical protein